MSAPDERDESLRGERAPDGRAPDGEHDESGPQPDWFEGERALLAEHGRPRAREDFRRELRARFLAEASEAAAGDESEQEESVGAQSSTGDAPLVELVASADASDDEVAYDPAVVAALEAELAPLLDRFGQPRARTRFRLVLARRFAADPSGSDLTADATGRARDDSSDRSARADRASSTARAPRSDASLTDHSGAADRATRSAGSRPGARGPRSTKGAARSSDAGGRRRSSGAHPTGAHPTGGPRRLAAVGGLVAAAAAIVLIWLRPFGADAPIPAPGPEWWVWPGQDVAQLVVDGESLAGLDAAEQGRRLGAASRIEVQGGDARFGLADLVAVELGAGSVLEFQEPGGLTDTGEIRLAGSHGSFRFATGPGFKAEERQLSMATPEAEVRIVGTVFGVDVYEGQGSCICCTEGTVAVQPVVVGTAEGRDLHSVPGPGMSFVFSAAEKSPVRGDVMPDHRPALVGLAADSAAFWPTRARD